MAVDVSNFTPPATSLIESRFAHLIADWPGFLQGCIQAAETFISSKASSLSGAEKDAAIMAYSQFAAWRFLCQSGEDKGGVQVGSIRVEATSAGISACVLANQSAVEAAKLTGLELEDITGVKSAAPTSQSLQLEVVW